MDMLVVFPDTNKTDILEGTMSDLSATGCAVISLSPVHQRHLH
jgi:hypothetical protein